MISAERLRELLDFDRDQGTFINRITRHPAAKAGGVAGSMTAMGYIEIGLEGRSYLAHRLAFLHVTGHWPVGEVDHRDGDKANNRWSNLRDVTHRQNNQNIRRATRASSTGLLGAYRNGRRFKASITIDGRLKHIGHFATAEEAHEAYLAAKRRFHEGNTL